jgi:ssDNA-binding replication factor A large subunit
MPNLLAVAKKIEKQLSAPMGDGGVYLDTLEELRAAIREEATGTDAAMQALAVEGSGQLMRAVIEMDGHVRAGEHLAALGAATPLPDQVQRLVSLLTVMRDIKDSRRSGPETRM